MYAGDNISRFICLSGAMPRPANHTFLRPEWLMLSTTFNGWLLLLRGAVTYVAAVSCAGGAAEYVNNGGNPMQYAKSVILNVEELDCLSFLPYLFGNDFLYAEASVYALAKKMMPEYEGGFWHFIRLPDGGGYMMPDGDRFHLVNGENWFDRTVSADAAGIILTSLVINRQLWLYHDSGDAGLTHLYRMRDAQLWSHIEFHPECNAIYAALD